ncbi:MAG: DNA-binding response regulator [Candidatus Hydrogenedentota bacterium]|nr:MAG: DNA-binding response regulator [Candidatus Hydrogenedentota bacterium]
MCMEITVNFIEDQPAAAEAMQIKLEKTNKFCVKHIFSLAAEAIFWLENHLSEAPHLWLVDLFLPDHGGIWAIQRIHTMQPKAKILVFTSFDNPSLLVRAIEVGANGYLLKDMRDKILMKHLEDALAGKQVFSPRIADYLLQNKITAKKSKNQAEPQIVLCKEGIEVLQNLASGYSIPEIATRLSTSKHKVQDHIYSIYAKLQENTDFSYLKGGGTY